MPLYEYRCEACQQRFEVIRKFSDPELEVCTLCGRGPVQRLQSSPAIQFKGSGWYITDYSQKGKAGKESTGTSTTDDAKPTSGGDAAVGTKTPGTRTDTATPAGKPAASD
jgi:putative FmdB family regulatory protein